MTMPVHESQTAPRTAGLGEPQPDARLAPHVAASKAAALNAIRQHVDRLDEVLETLDRVQVAGTKAARVAMLETRADLMDKALAAIRDALDTA